MKKHAVISIALFVATFISPFALKAAGLYQPIGGRISAGPLELQTAITCAASYGPFMLFPFTAGAPGPFFVQGFVNGTPRMGAYFLGLYSSVPTVGACINPETSVPVPAFDIKIHGFSR